MFGISYGELFLLLGATAALIGPKDLPIIARTAGKLAGRSIGYVQLARGQFDNIMQQNQARQVHKELQDTIAQLEAIRHEVRSLSFMNPGTMSTRLVDNIKNTATATATATASVDNEEQISDTVENVSTDTEAKVLVESSIPTPTASGFSDMHSQAAVYAKLAESAPIKPGIRENNEVLNELTDESGLMVLPVSAESAKLLPERRDNANGSDIVLEAVLEAEVARNAKEFFAQQHSELKIQ